MENASYEGETQVNQYKTQKNNNGNKELSGGVLVGYEEISHDRHTHSIHYKG